MERFTENILLGYTPQRSLEILMKMSDTNWDTDFSDVFGGPPRRFSIQETRRSYSFRETRVESEVHTVLPRNPWSGLDEKPVFGEEGVSRSPYRSDDFFDDIFKGDEVKSRRTSRDFFASSPSMRILSPSRPLPPKAEPFSPSFPAKFSLPAKLTKATDSLLFGSTNRSPYKNKHGSSNGISYGLTPNALPSRFASQATDIQDDTRDDRPLYCKSHLSYKVFHSRQEPSYEGKSDEKNVEVKLRNYSESKKVPLNSGQFHFSIHKWAGSGEPSLMPLGGQCKLRFKGRFKTERCSSSNGRIESDSIGRHLPAGEEHIISLHAESVSLEISNGKHNESGKEKKAESCSDVEEAHVAEPNFFGSERHAIPQDEDISRKKTEESHTKHETTVYDESEKETNVNKRQAPKTKLKSLHAQLSDDNQVLGEGNATEGKEKKAKITNIANKDANLSTNAKKTDAERSISNRSGATDANLHSPVINSGDAYGRSSVKGKVRESVKIFNQETSAKPKSYFGCQSSRWKGMDINGTENGMSNAVKTDEKVHKLNKVPDTSGRKDENFNKNQVKQESHCESTGHGNSGLSTNEKNTPTFSDLLPNDSDNKFQSRDESILEDFTVEELTEVDDKMLQTSGDFEDIKASNAKIRQWSNGRKGNIHSLLSTLQLVLWRESGWKPVPLVDLIEGSAVKRAYQRALLCLHPDKLQQKGAASHQKYIAEQVFEILQEAWDHFSSLGAIFTT